MLWIRSCFSCAAASRLSVQSKETLGTNVGLALKSELKEYRGNSKAVSI